MNFEKRRREFELLAQLTLYQKSASAYAFPHNPQLVQWLRDSRVPSEQERCGSTLSMMSYDVIIIIIILLLLFYTDDDHDITLCLWPVQ